MENGRILRLLVASRQQSNERDRPTAWRHVYVREHFRNLVLLVIPSICKINKLGVFLHVLLHLLTFIQREYNFTMHMFYSTPPQSHSPGLAHRIYSYYYSNTVSLPFYCIKYHVLILFLETEDKLIYKFGSIFSVLIIVEGGIGSRYDEEKVKEGIYILHKWNDCLDTCSDRLYL